MSIGLTKAARKAGVPLEFAQEQEAQGALQSYRRTVQGMHGAKLCGYHSGAIHALRASYAANTPTTAPDSAHVQTLPPVPDEPWRKLTDYERSVFLNDVHCPYQDAAAVGVTLAFLRWFQPSNIFLVGDIIDFYQLSKFDKDPTRLLKLQDDINSTVDFLEQVRRVAPNATIRYFLGNHEDRLRRYLWRHPELAGLDNMRIESLLHLVELRMECISAETVFTWHGFCVEHGEIVRKCSGYTARGQMEKRGISGLSGHTHRLGTHYHSNLGGDFLWVENGCICSRTPDYTKAPDWQQGFSCGHWRPENERFSLEQVLISDGMACFAGREFTALKAA